MVGYTGDKEEVLKRLNRIEGQVRGIQKMVESDRYCIDVCTQVNAARAALESVSLLLVRDHIEHCIKDAVATGDAAPKVRELAETIERMVRS